MVIYTLILEITTMWFSPKTIRTIRQEMPPPWGNTWNDTRSAFVTAFLPGVPRQPRWNWGISWGWNPTFLVTFLRKHWKNHRNNLEDPRKIHGRFELGKSSIVYKWWIFHCHVWLPEGNREQKTPARKIIYQWVMMGLPPWSFPKSRGFAFGLP